MTQPTSQATVDQYELRAREIEGSPMPMLLRIGRVFVWILWALVVAVAALLTLAFVLRLFGASADAPFAEWVYRSAESAMRPFRGMFPPHQISDTSIFDPSLLFGALFYLVLALLIDGLLRWLGHRLSEQQHKERAARAAADAAAQQLANQEYAVRQSATHDYAVAQAAAQQVIASQQGPGSSPLVPPSAPPTR